MEYGQEGKMVLWYLGARRFDQYCRMVDADIDSDITYRAVLTLTLRHGDPRAELPGGRIVT